MSKQRVKEVDITPEVETLAARPYRLVIWRDEDDGAWCGEIPELPGHIAAADTIEEMLALAEDAKRAWIATALSLGRPVPPPSAIEDTPMKSGKFLVRVPPPVHTALVREADRQGVSLNELVSDTLALVVAKGFDGVVRAVAESNITN
ncbi:MAG: toxin-antitoxin system HicB family antitoxin [Thermomicrobiales bacterium]